MDDATHDLTIRVFREGDQPAVIALWERCAMVRPGNDPATDIARKVAAQPDMLFVAEIDAAIVGSCMAGYDGRRGWLNYLCVEPRLRGRGIGRRLVRHAEQVLWQRGCPKVNLQVLASNSGVIGFYERLGYREDKVVSMGRRLDPQETVSRA